MKWKSAFSDKAQTKHRSYPISSFANHFKAIGNQDGYKVGLRHCTYQGPPLIGYEWFGLENRWD